MSVMAIIERRRDAIVAEWVRNPTIMVQTASPQSLGRFDYIDVSAGPSTIETLGRRGINAAGVWRRPGAPDTSATLWVASAYEYYRPAYRGFIRAVYDMKVPVESFAGFDVDHLLNRARSPNGSVFLRVEACPRTINQEWGSLFEKVASSPFFYANRERVERSMSWVIASKLAWQAAPYGPDDSRGVERLAQFWAGRGLSLVEARKGIQSQLNFAFGGGTKVL